eukprot:CAMPEP_0115162458 /NCGR_PEP_ID=MMETSP0227-20121206/71970_1 /TAXON_ID=89957 /ORGANISM="Polarella glacialis, Strain CCMP 1383" /LENGTH=74 /DNA_ID=CAMNT_0002574665 /DNA_START=423 /DNA_END=647 /DNA_ORIENTATION=-
MPSPLLKSEFGPLLARTAGDRHAGGAAELRDQVPFVQSCRSAPHWYSQRSKRARPDTDPGRIAKTREGKASLKR